MDQLSIGRATLAFTCANGFYAIAAAKKAPERIVSMVLSQTPSLTQMRAWVDRRIPRAVRFPFVGQALVVATGRRAANRWYPAALAEGTDATTYQAIARKALVAGGCFCLAGIVQGLMNEESAALSGVETPTTMVWGGGDRSHQPTDPESIKEHLPLASVERYRDCGHFPDLEQPTRFAALLRGLRQQQNAF
jgi:pimeloyl-ACP methyl ester carboxylesterase